MTYLFTACLRYVCVPEGKVKKTYLLILVLVMLAISCSADNSKSGEPKFTISNIPGITPEVMSALNEVFSQFGESTENLTQYYSQTLTGTDEDLEGKQVTGLYLNKDKKEYQEISVETYSGEGPFGENGETISFDDEIISRKATIAKTFIPTTTLLSVVHKNNSTIIKTYSVDEVKQLGYEFYKFIPTKTAIWGSKKIGESGNWEYSENPEIACLIKESDNKLTIIPLYHDNENSRYEISTILETPYEGYVYTKN